MCLSHAALHEDLTFKESLMKDRPSADPNDPELLALSQQLAALGMAPRRCAHFHLCCAAESML